MSLFNTPEQFSQAHKNNIEALLAIANATFASTERLANLNLNTTRSLLEEIVSHTRTLLQIKDPQQLLDLQKNLHKPLVDTAAIYSRSIYEILSQTQSQINHLIEEQVGELNKALSGALDEAAKSAPAGSDPAFTAVKSALAAANNAYDSVSQAAKQVADIAEANVTTTTTKTAAPRKSAAKKTTS